MLTTRPASGGLAVFEEPRRLAFFSSGPLEQPDGATPARRAALSRLTFAAMFAASLLLLAAGFALSSSGLRGVGGAPLALSARFATVERAALSLLIGVSTATVVGSAMVLLPLWHPLLAALLVGVPAVAAHTIGTRRAVAELRGHPTAARGVSITPAELGSPICTVIGGALWIGAAASLHDREPAPWGFLTHISPLWFVGLVALIVAIVLARRQREMFIAAPMVLLVAALTVTPALVYGEPRSQTALKHVALVQQILSAPHHLHASSYIYYAYSGFFSAIAWLMRVANVGNPLPLATFWPAIVALGATVALRFLFSRMFRSSYRCWAGVGIAVLADAVGQDYFSPQSVGYVLVICAYGLALAGRPVGLSPRSRIALLVLAGCALAVMHELSPYIAGGSLLVLAVFNAATPRWAALTMLVPAGLWAAINSHALAGFFSLSALGNLSNFAPPSTGTASGLSRAPTIAESSDALTLGLLMVVILALVGVARNRRERGAWALMISAGVGLVFIAINPYGNEGIFRAALFGIPWLTLLTLASVGHARRSTYGLAALLSAMVATYCVASFAIDGFTVVRKSDINALHTFLARASPGAYRVTFGGNGDLPTTVSKSIHYLTWDPLADQTARATGTPTASDLVLVTRSYDNYGRKVSGTSQRNLFVIWSRTAVEYAREYGLETPANGRAWLALLTRSPLWKLVFSSSDSYLFQRTAAPA
jgi:hypothetical protein